jgi:tRNA(Ile)-lysidine synthase
MDLLDRVRRIIRAHDLARPDTRVLVALSGGSDSVALAYLLAELAQRNELRVAGVVHLNHQLRPAADDEEAFCGELAARLGWPFRSRRADVAARARAERRSVEDAARAARYEFFGQARLRLEADAIALGHTRDDQAETFLLRLIRGAGSRGLSGMHPRRGHIIRPLLDCRRRELRSFLEERGVPFVHDESNDDVSIPRNRVRAELLPLLERRFNPSIIDVLADEARLAREEWDWIRQTAGDVAAEVVSRPEKDVWLLDVSALERLPAALTRAIVRDALVQASGGRPISFRHVEDALNLADPPSPRRGSGAGAMRGGPIDGPGVRMERRGHVVVLTSRGPGAPAQASANLFRYSLSIPGEVALREAGCVVSAEAAASAGSATLSNAAVAVLQLDRCRMPLAVRNRRPGDRFRPLGLGGRKKLQDYFVDKKIPRARRDQVPLVVDETDRIVWVAGHGIDDEFRVTDPAQAVLILRLRQV